MSGTIVTVANHSGQTIESCILKGPGVKVELGPIPSGSERLAYLSFRGDGMLSFSAREADVSFDGEFSEYVTGGIGGEMTLELLPGRDFKVTENVTSGD